jgi:hypothetical protein
VAEFVVEEQAEKRAQIAALAEYAPFREEG